MGDRKVPRSRDDLKKFRDEVVHQFHVVSEGVIDQVKLVAESVATVNNKLDRTRQELKEEIDSRTQPITQAVLELSGKVGALDGRVGILDGRVGALDGKVGALDGKVVALDNRVGALDGKVVALDGKVGRIPQELKTEIKETRQEILAAVKFSYAELDSVLQPSKKNSSN